MSNPQTNRPTATPGRPSRRRAALSAGVRTVLAVLVVLVAMIAIVKIIDHTHHQPAGTTRNIISRGAPGAGVARRTASPTPSTSSAPSFPPPPSVNRRANESLTQIGFTPIGHIPNAPRSWFLWSVNCLNVPGCNLTGVIANSDMPAIITHGKYGPAIGVISQYGGHDGSQPYRVTCRMQPTKVGIAASEWQDPVGLAIANLFHYKPTYYQGYFPRHLNWRCWAKRGILPD